MTNHELLIMLKLSIQRALLDEVTNRLVSVTCGLREQRITIRAYVSGVVTEEDIERIQSIGAEVIADFSEGYTIQESCLPAGEHEEEMLDFWAFRRAAQP
jgi:nicotinate-nucleotide pyrophosphorylase